MRDYKSICLQYIEDVQKGNIISGIYLKKAVQRFVKDMKRSKDEDFLFYFDWDCVQAVCGFAEELKPGDLSGEKLKLLPWQIFCFANLEGWRYKMDPERKRFRMAYIEVNRKQGKTTGLLLPLVLYNFLKYKASESYIVSSRDDLAEKTFKEVRDIVHADSNLEDLLDCKSLAIIFRDLEEKSRLGFFCDGGKDADGFRPRFVALDEYHAFASDKMFTSMQYGMRSKKDAQMVVITTADTEVNCPCYEQNLKAKRILNGTQTQEDFFCVIYAIDETDDYHNPAVWQKANPSLYDIIDPSVIQADIDDAELTPHKIPELKAKTFGIWGGGGEKSWLPVETWQKNKDIVFNENDFIDCSCVGGLDLSQVDDLSGYVLKFKRDGKSYFLHRWYIPEQTLSDRYRKENANFFGWAEKGIIRTIPGPTIDYEFIVRDFLEDAEKFNIQALGYDKWHARDVIDGIEAQRPDIMLIEIEQSLKKLSPIFKSYEKEIKEGKVVDNSPLSLWAMHNVEIRPDANDNYKPMKKSKASTQRIDPIVACTMAHGVSMLVNDDEVQKIDKDTLLAIL